MQSIKLTRQSPFSAQQMFDLITDVDRYEEFIPYCTAARVRKRSEIEMLADLAIGYKMLRESYRSRIELGAEPLTVTVHQVKGPFRHLFNQWVFEDTATGCDVHFELRFEFAVPVLRHIIEPIMNRVIERFVAAFEARALDIYG